MNYHHISGDISHNLIFGLLNLGAITADFITTKISYDLDKETEQKGLSSNYEEMNVFLKHIQTGRDFILSPRVYSMFLLRALIGTSIPAFGLWYTTADTIAALHNSRGNRRLQRAIEITKNDSAEV